MARAAYTPAGQGSGHEAFAASSGRGGVRHRPKQRRAVLDGVKARRCAPPRFAGAFGGLDAISARRTDSLRRRRTGAPQGL
jgi:hypothetical protein